MLLNLVLLVAHQNEEDFIEKKENNFLKTNLVRKCQSFYIIIIILYKIFGMLCEILYFMHRNLINNISE